VLSTVTYVCVCVCVIETYILRRMSHRDIHITYYIYVSHIEAQHTTSHNTRHEHHTRYMHDVNTVLWNSECTCIMSTTPDTYMRFHTTMLFKYIYHINIYHTYIYITAIYTPNSIILCCSYCIHHINIYYMYTYIIAMCIRTL
jgi:hypothetical protein